MPCANNCGETTEIKDGGGGSWENLGFEVGKDFNRCFYKFMIICIFKSFAELSSW